MYVGTKHSLRHTSGAKMPLLKLSNLEGGYGDIKIINGVDMMVERGHVATIVGPNGAGKSTLLRCIVGLVSTFSGTVEFDGQDITGLDPNSAIEHGICFVPQTHNIFPNLSILENLKMGSWKYDGDFEDRLEQVYDLFPLLRERKGYRTGNLSGGQQQMVAIGSALVTDPELLILDEPSAGLAPKLVEDIFEKVGQINDRGTTVLMVEQNAQKALENSDHGIVLAMGRKKFEGDSAELLESETFAEYFLGNERKTAEGSG